MTEVTRESSFDALTSGLASGTLSRRKALKLLGAALLGGAALASTPGVALARPCSAGRTRCGNQCCTSNQACLKGQGGNPRCITESPLCGTCPRNTYCCAPAGATATEGFGCCGANQGCAFDPTIPGSFPCTD
jgi:hypothetical protein